MKLNSKTGQKFICGLKYIIGISRYKQRILQKLRTFTNKDCTRDKNKT